LSPSALPRFSFNLSLSLALLLVAGCGADDASRPPVVPPVTSRPVHTAADAEAPRVDGSSDVVAPVVDAGAPSLAPPPSIPEPTFGAGSVKPGDAQPFRLAVATRAMRANASGANIAKMFSVVPAIVEVKKKTGVDPFADGEWLLVYGSKVEVPGPNAHVVKHTKSEAELTKAIAASGVSSADGHAQMLGVRGVLLRPQASVLAFVPDDRAKDFAVVLAKAIDPGVKPGELARIFLAEPSKVAKFLPAEIVRASVIVKPAADGGLDAAAEADCSDAAICASTATDVDELVKRQNSIMVRIVLKNVLASVAVRADGTKLKATMHASPSQVDAALSLIRAQLGLPTPTTEVSSPTKM
jgi:hypothetical protein